MHSNSFNTWLGALLSALMVMFALRTIVAESKSEGAPEKAGFEVAELKDDAGGKATVEGPKAADPPVAVALKTADADTGKALTKACQACHSFEKGGANKVGPNLYGVVGRKPASHEGYTYSDAMKAKAGNWGYEEMYTFLANPKGVVAGTKMTYAGLAKPEDRANVIAYLRTLADTPVPLP
jgi:cytochrome c